MASKSSSKDYDVDGSEEWDLSEDENGDEFIESIWER